MYWARLHLILKSAEQNMQVCFFDTIPLRETLRMWFWTIFITTRVWMQNMQAINVRILMMCPSDWNSSRIIGTACLPLIFIPMKRWEKLIRFTRSEEHTSELQSRPHLVCRLL